MPRGTVALKCSVGRNDVGPAPQRSLLMPRGTVALKCSVGRNDVDRAAVGGPVLVDGEAHRTNLPC
jgi:IMP dehydrogenase/GMP reductase